MRSSLLIVALAASANAFADRVQKHALMKRQDASTSYLPAIIAAATPSCLTGCQDIPKIIAQCAANGGGEEAIGRCACGQSSLGIVLGCATCITKDPVHTGGQVPLMQYNAFANQCISLGFANGTALAPVAGESVTTAKQITTFASSGATAATGPARASGSSVANQNAAASVTPAATASSTSGAEKLVGAGVLSALVVAVGAVLV